MLTIQILLTDCVILMRVTCPMIISNLNAFICKKNKEGPKTVIHVRFLRLTCLSWIILTTHLNGHITFNASSFFWDAFHIWYHQWHLCVQLVYEPHPHCGGQPGKVNKSREWRYHVTVGTGWGMCHEKRSFKSNMSQASAISVGFLFQAGETSGG